MTHVTKRKECKISQVFNLNKSKTLKTEIWTRTKRCPPTINSEYTTCDTVQIAIYYQKKWKKLNKFYANGDRLQNLPGDWSRSKLYLLSLVDSLWACPRFPWGPWSAFFSRRGLKFFSFLFPPPNLFKSRSPMSTKGRHKKGREQKML